MEVCWLSISSNKVAINPCLVNTVKFPLVFKKVRFTKRPGLRHRQPIQLIANLHQPFVRLLEPFVNPSFPTGRQLRVCVNGPKT